MDDLQGLLRNLCRINDQPQQPVNPIGDTGNFPSTVGVGSRKNSNLDESRGGVYVEADLVEIATVYSYILLTEDGAYEVPPTYPTSGVYARPGRVYSTIPNTLTLSGSAYIFDVDAAVYKQRRAHVSYYGVTTSKNLSQTGFYVPFERPYDTLGYCSGLRMFGAGVIPAANSLTPTYPTPNPSPLVRGSDLKMYVTVNPYFEENERVKKLLSFLNSLGIVKEAT